MLHRLLGPVEFWDGSRWLGLRQAKWRALLAILLCRANQAISAGQLIEELWGQQPPRSAGKLLHACVSTCGAHSRSPGRDPGDPRTRLRAARATR